MYYYYSGYEKFKLWEELNKRSNLSHEKEIMKEIIDMAVQKLDRIIESYPAYTLHNHNHSENVIKNIEKFLKDRIQDLTDTELIVLILSAYMHDIGMYYNPDEIDTIVKSDEFMKYLDEHSTEYLKYKNSDGNFADVINEYCRCYHGKRIRNFISELNTMNIKLNIMGLNILDKAAAVCESHNDSVRSIIDNPDLNSRLGYESDMKFCAILLRLADYTDFDGSRTPEYMYKFINIEGKSKKSIDNWKMHLNSGGFHFEMDDVSVLGYLAEPNEPYVEYTIRCLLDEIEKELRECKEIIQQNCNNRWRDFKLPYGIDRNQIKSQGYDYGEYTFTLKKERILDLFMGEQLYTDKYVFIREIIQNAIDTSSYRKFWEESRGAEHFKVPPIEIYDWLDEYGNHYVRINDYGMGMNTKIIENYFLKVGESYYKSDDFIAEKMKIQNQSAYKSDFQPISQFGIGFLSCFLMCDSIEIYTCCRPIDNTSSDIIRLSIKGAEDFYTLRLNNNANGIPNKPGYSERLENYGTSIVFHLNPESYDSGFRLDELVKKYVFCPPTAIIINGQLLEYMNDEFIYKKLINTEKRIELSETENPECITYIKKWLHKANIPKILLRIIPCNITELSLSPNFLGQGIFYLIESENPIKITDILFERTYSISEQYGKLEVRLNKTINAKEYSKMESKLKLLLSSLGNFQSCLNQNNRTIGQDLLSKILSKINEIEEIVNNWRSISNSDMETYLNELGNYLNAIKTELRHFLSKTGSILYKNIIFSSINKASEILNIILNMKKQIEDESEYRFYISLPLHSNLHQLPVLSYNGIIIPNISNKKKVYFKYTDHTYLRFGIMPFCFILRNDLRPQLNLARNFVYKMEWNVYSNINITMKNFFHKYKIYKTTEPFERINSHLTYREILDDKYVKNEWKKYKIIQTTDGYLSFYEICDKMNRKIPVKLTSLFRQRQKEKMNFYTICSHTLLQQEFNILIKPKRKYYEGRCFLKPIKNTVNRFNESYYAPLFFADFEASDYKNMLCLFNTPLNRNHPFSAWLLSVTPDLYNNYHEFFNAIVKCFDDLSIYNSQTIANRLNNILQQLNKTAPELNFKNDIKIIGYDTMLC